MVKAIVDDVYRLGISKIALEKLKGIRGNNDKNGKVNSMIHNFWSYKYIIQRFKDKAKEYGIEVEKVSEYQSLNYMPKI